MSNNKEELKREDLEESEGASGEFEDYMALSPAQKQAKAYKPFLLWFMLIGLKDNGHVVLHYFDGV